MRTPVSPSLTLAEFIAMAKRGFDYIPVYAEMLGDLDSPVSLFYRLGGDIIDRAFLLESVVGRENVSRWSFIGVEFYRLIRAKNENIEIIEIGPSGETTRSVTGANPFDVLGGELHFGEVYADHKLPAFLGGAVGYVSYDGIRYTENIPAKNNDDLGLPDLQFLFTESLVIYDHVDRAIRPTVIARVREKCGNLTERSDAHLAELYADCFARLCDLAARLAAPLPDARTRFVVAERELELRPNMTDADFEAAVARCIEFIKAGDAFQILPSRRFEFDLDVPGFQVYRALRLVNPSPYMYYLRLDDLQIIGSSPEILVKVKDRTVTIRPIAGTRPRGKNESEDTALVNELLNDPKELAEHLMLIDLGRNDVGRVAEFQSVRVDEIMAIEKYSHVMHIVSNVTGRLEKGKSCLDAVRAGLPAGTLSGAPKIRAMEIIDELEPSVRGPYGGALGYFSFHGDADLAIIIRTIIAKGSRAWTQAGAGIVFDSVPANELAEVSNKLAGVLKALQIARAGGYK